MMFNLWTDGFPWDWGGQWYVYNAAVGAADAMAAKQRRMSPCLPSGKSRRYQSEAME